MWDDDLDLVPVRDEDRGWLATILARYMVRSRYPLQQVNCSVERQCAWAKESEAGGR